MKTLISAVAAISVVGLLASSGPKLAVADPCGMVPPLIIPENQIAIERVGAQMTFVSHYRGVETMVLRPGFKGQIDEFGMLIPFPSPPALRKVDDDIFTQVAAAAEPPEVHAYVWNRRRMMRSKMSNSGMGGAVASADSFGDGGARLGYNAVRVVNREAVGMYDVAVLAAGSSVALKRWMDDNGFRYPAGMERVTQDYVDSGWFFVAVKTQVGSKGAVNPKPGMKKANPKLPKGSSFTGAVQGMGFRFKTKELVVPMRLSAFNAGKKRNLVYVLTNKPVRIKNIPTRYVVRQIRGRDLYKNLTGPLPLRVFNGSFKQLQPSQKKQLKTQRRPEKFNALAKELIASDMLAIRKGRLANPIEETEKELLAIGEGLDLRGKELDAAHRDALKKLRGKAEAQALRAVRNLTLTVIDGEFNSDVIARENLTFTRYSMPKKRNSKEAYDPTMLGPRGKQAGKVYTASIDALDAAQAAKVSRTAAVTPLRHWLVGSGAGLGLMILLGGLIRARSAHSSHRSDGIHRPSSRS